MSEIKNNSGYQRSISKTPDPGTSGSGPGTDAENLSISRVGNTSSQAYSRRKTIEPAPEDISDIPPLTMITARGRDAASRSPHVLPVALAAAQQAGHSTERQRMLKRPLVRMEKRNSTDRRRRNLGPSHGSERRKSDRRIRAA